MRIISDIRDYYDGVQAHGADPKLVYERRTRGPQKIRDLVPDVRALLAPVETAWRDVPDLGLTYLTRRKLAGRRGGRRFDPPIHTFVVGFCGTLVPGWVVELPDETHRHFYSIEALIDFALDPEIEGVRPMGPRRAVALRAEKTRRHFWSDRVWYASNGRGEAEWIADHGTVPVELHRALASPVFMLNLAGKLVVNPWLASWGFASAVDPWSAYQRIATYLGSDMAEQRDPDEGISDEDRAAMKGHGGEYSFRTRPGMGKKGTRRQR